MHLKQHDMGLFIIPAFSTQVSGSGRWKITHLAPTVEKKIHLRPWLQLSEREPLLRERISQRKQTASEFCFDVTHKDANNKITLFSAVHSKQAGFRPPPACHVGNLWDFRT